MSFIPRRSAPPGRPGTSATRVLAIGRRVFVHCTSERQGSVALTDENGTASSSRLADGVEVEVLAWRPRGSEGTRYRVRASADGSAGWLSAANLRTVAVAPPPAPPTPAGEMPAADVPRRFGQRR